MGFLARLLPHVSLLFLTLGTSCGSSDSDEVTRERCERLRDHVVELQLASIPASMAPPKQAIPDPKGGVAKEVTLPAVSNVRDIAGHRAAMTQALGDAYVASCEKNLSATQLTCALAATDAASAAGCETASK